MTEKLTGKIYRSIVALPYRYSTLFGALRTIFSYEPAEEIINKAMAFITYSRIGGDYLEFGVYKGNSFAAAYHLAQKHGLREMKFYAFDSFQGLPEISGLDIHQSNVLEKSDCACSLKKFQKIIARKGVDPKKVTAVAGWYKDTLNEKTKKELPIKKAAVIYVDCDFYESTVAVLNFITDYLQDGTVLIFDDWFLFRGSPNYGEQKAFSQWLAAHPYLKTTEFQKSGWASNSFIIHCQWKEQRKR